jgi:inorganic triphosphatase YgiF
MATEIELKLSLSPAAAKAVRQHPLLADVEPVTQVLLNTYYDTPELDLRRQKIALRFRKRGWEWLLTVKSAEPSSGGLARRSEWEIPAIPGAWTFGHVDDGDLRLCLEAAAPRLEPVFTTNFRRTAWTVDYGNSRIEVALDRGRIESQDRREALCEVELELISGEVGDLFGFARELLAALPLRPSVASKAERGYRLYTAAPEQPFKSRAPALDPELSPIGAFREIAYSCLEQLQRNEPGILGQPDPEYVHQARVALRRLRSAIKVFAPILPEAFVSIWGSAWRALAGALGDARNWDVFVAETLPPILTAFPDDRTSLRLDAAGRANAANARTTLKRLLALPEYPRLVLEFTAAVFELDDCETPGSLADFARDSLAHRARRAARLARAHASLSDIQRHALRIRFKKLRYTLEFFASLLPARRLRPYAAALAQLQDELGLINDHVTAIDLVSRLPDKYRSGPVLGWLSGRHALLLAQLPEALDTWLAQPAPWKRK